MKAQSVHESTVKSNRSLSSLVKIMWRLQAKAEENTPNWNHQGWSTSLLRMEPFQGELQNVPPQCHCCPLGGAILPIAHQTWRDPELMRCSHKYKKRHHCRITIIKPQSTRVCVCACKHIHTQPSQSHLESIQKPVTPCTPGSAATFSGVQLTSWRHWKNSLGNTWATRNWDSEHVRFNSTYKYICIKTKKQWLNKGPYFKCSPKVVVIL